jgi:hypothetical protein
LLKDLASGEPQAIAMVERHVPAAKGMAPEQIQQLRFRLAGAQLAIARETGFASWPRLSRHVEQLRALEGT